MEFANKNYLLLFIIIIIIIKIDKLYWFSYTKRYIIPETTDPNKKQILKDISPAERAIKRSSLYLLLLLSFTIQGQMSKVFV